MEYLPDIQHSMVFIRPIFGIPINQLQVRENDVERGIYFMEKQCLILELSIGNRELSNDDLEIWVGNMEFGIGDLEFHLKSLEF